MESYLMTWRVLHIDERLATGTPFLPAWCDQISGKGPAPAPEEMALGLGGGTKVIEGVTIQFTSRDSDVNLVAGHQYLVLLRSCPSGQAGLSFDVDSVYAVSKDGTIASSRGGRPFVKELQAVGNLQNLRALIADVKAPR